MSDTLVEPPPPTLPDIPPDAAPQAAAQPSRSRRGCVLVAALAVVAMLLAGALVYVLVWRGKAKALDHVPDRTTFVARFDAREFALFAPVRKHLWPLLVGGKSEAPPNGAKPKPSRADRIREATGVGPTDVREIVVASTDASSWVLLVGGSMSRGGFVSGVAKVLREEGETGWNMVGDLLVGPSGVAVGQAEDGTLVLGTDAEIARAALPATDEWTELGLPDAPASFAMTTDAWRGLGTLVGAVPRGDVLGRVQHGAGTLRLGDKPEVEMRLQAATGVDATQLAGDVDGFLSALKLVTLLSRDRYGEKEALHAATSQAEGGLVVLRAPWPMEGLDRACQDIATRLGGGPAPP